MTKRLSNALKKKLELSLTSLTARQAGRLFLIYSNEFFSNDETGMLADYPPVAELKDAWDKRVNASRSKPIEMETVAAYNGFTMLTRIIREANRIAESDLWRLYTLAISQGSIIDRLLLKDSYSDITRVTISLFTDDVPRPLSWDNYNKATDWYESYSPEDMEELSNFLTENYANRQGYTILEVPEEFLKKISTPEVKYAGEDEDIRRKWAESEGEAGILKKHFAGDKDRFEAWKKHGGSPKFNGREWDTMADEILDRLVNKVISGELEGGICFSLDNHWGGIPALGWDKSNPEDTSQLFIPAWNALRSIWISWLYDIGIFRGDEKRVEKYFPDILETFYNVDGTINDDQITSKAKEFYLECRKKPWGGELIDVGKVDFAFLGHFLCAAASPLLGYYAPDLGTVKVKTFQEVEGDDPFLGPPDTAGDTWYYATLRGLRKIAEEFEIEPDKIGNNFVREFYFPTDDPEAKRDTISILLRRMGQLRVSHRPFTYKEKNKREISSFLGREFYTPLEAAIREFGKVFDDLDTFKLTYDLLSQEFFEGIPILNPILRDRLKGVEEALKTTEDNLNNWIEKFSTDSDIWNVDTSSLRLVKDGPHEKMSRFTAAGIIYHEDDGDNSKAPAYLDGGETFESIAKKICGFDYSGMKKEFEKALRGTK